MEVMSAREAANKWGISQRRVAILCAEGLIEQAKLVGNSWIIPVTALKPIDARRVRRVNLNDGRARPFLKWAGGKSQLLSEIKEYYPFAYGKITKYAEPFVGGGAVFFDILGKYNLDEVYISDINQDLINAYKIVKMDVDNLIKALKQMQADFIHMEIVKRNIYYLDKRDKFNKLKIGQNASSNLELAALFIFLNKTCFNGLYRVNKKGSFNVPMGKYINPVICDEENLRLASEKLQRAKIICGDYHQATDFIDRNTFVYIDPPYRPLSKTANFTSYSVEAFDDDRQVELANFVHHIDKTGAYIVISNSDPKNTNTNDDFFDCLYAKFNIKRVDAARVINSKSAARGKVKELLISNFTR